MFYLISGVLLCLLAGIVVGGLIQKSNSKKKDKLITYTGICTLAGVGVFTLNYLSVWVFLVLGVLWILVYLYNKVFNNV